jgi:hypothetical protein
MSTKNRKNGMLEGGCVFFFSQNRHSESVFSQNFVNQMLGEKGGGGGRVEYVVYMHAHIPFVNRFLFLIQSRTSYRKMVLLCVTVCFVTFQRGRLRCVGTSR